MVSSISNRRDVPVSAPEAKPTAAEQRRQLPQSLQVPQAQQQAALTQKALPPVQRVQPAQSAPAVPAQQMDALKTEQSTVGLGRANAAKPANAASSSAAASQAPQGRSMAAEQAVNAYQALQPPGQTAAAQASPQPKQNLSILA